MTDDLTTNARKFASASARYEGAEVSLWVHNLCDELDRLRAQVAALEAERDALRALCAEWERKAATWMASPEAQQRLDGYRELAQRAGDAEAEVERLRAENAHLRERLSGAEADARRYLYLHKSMRGDGLAQMEAEGCLVAKDMDAAIDAAIDAARTPEANRG